MQQNSEKWPQVLNFWIQVVLWRKPFYWKINFDSFNDLTLPIWVANISNENWFDLKENEIHVTNYTFLRRGQGSDWEICSLGHLTTADHWTWFRRFKWKGRLHISIQFNIPFLRALRYDYIIDTTWVCLLIYLQILALVLARKAEEGDNMNMIDGELEGVYWRTWSEVMSVWSAHCVLGRRYKD